MKNQLDILNVYFLLASCALVLKESDRLGMVVELKVQFCRKNVRQGIVMKTSFETWVLRMGLSSFVDINIFVMKYYLILVSLNSTFF